jgi:hypothetical protein
LISGSKIKTYWNMFINMVTADTLPQDISFLSRRISVVLLSPPEGSEVQDGAHPTATQLLRVGIC